jgi:chemotaxis protein CheX
MSIAASSRSLTDSDWMIPFVDAVKHVCETMLQSRCQVGPVTSVGSGHRMYPVTAVIGLSGELSGSLSFSVRVSGACQIAARMTGMECTEVDELVRDGVGEMANMIAGAGKRNLTGVKLSLGLPQVILGEEYTVYSPRWCKHFWTPLVTDIGDASLDVGFDTSNHFG